VKTQDFCYWLQGFLELRQENKEISVEQVKVIQNHLNLVFQHDIDPKQSGDPVKLQSLHDGKTQPTKQDGPIYRC